MAFSAPTIAQIAPYSRAGSDNGQYDRAPCLISYQRKKTRASDSCVPEATSGIANQHDGAVGCDRVLDDACHI